MISSGKKSLTRGGAGRVRERRDGRRGVAAQGHRVSGEESRRGNAQRAARRGGVRACRGPSLDSTWLRRGLFDLQ